jgi:hypothetical protein
MTWRSACAVLIFVAVTLVESCAVRSKRPIGAAESEQTAAAQQLVAKSTNSDNNGQLSAQPTPKAEVLEPKSSFESSIRPVLATRCAPCHEPGGKMYERLPFDDSKTVSSHADGIRGRLKGEDREALERWLESLPPSPNSE